jgi:3-oxoacyl-[acyl-carrier protein] reductase
MVDWFRWAPQDIAEVALFLASDAAHWITGQNVQAGGGVV